ncbi:MAG: hypothetical protein ABIH52_01525 [Candidatus Aenigmatarchaeota archaeon]|nr:hypothetical protein [Nanoarchaeota archaeon]
MPGVRKDGRRTVSSVLNELIENTNSDTRRLRLLEQNSSIDKERLNRIEKDLAEQKRTHMKDMETLQIKLEQQGVQMVKMENYIKEMIKQIKRSATKADIGGLEELVGIFNPLTSKFVTKQEVMQMIKEKK